MTCDLASRARSSTSPRRRGTVYILVLGVATILMIIGLSVSGIARSQIRAAAIRSLVSSASTEAMGSLELAAEIFSLYPEWRLDLGNTGVISDISLGSARSSLTIVDESDGLLWNDDTQPVRVYATATVGGVQRICSQVFEPDQRTPWAALSAAMIADRTIEVGTLATFTAVNGPVISNSSFTSVLGSQINADIVTPSMLQVLGGRTGTTTISSTSTPLPSGNAWATLTTMATTINYTSLVNDRIEKTVLSRGRNAYGPTSSAGIYFISVPSGRTLEIRDCRIDATLLIQLANTAKLNIGERVTWTPSAGGVALLVRADAQTSSLTIGNIRSDVNESDVSVNLNDSTSPYLGVADSDLADRYPGGITGVVCLIGRGRIYLEDGAVVRGCVISENVIGISGTVSVTADPALALSPPLGFASPMLVRPRAGTFRWELEATRDAAIANAAALAGSATPPSGRTSTIPTSLLTTVISNLQVK